MNDGTPLARKHGFAAELTASPGPARNTFGNFASAAFAAAGGLACCAGDRVENAETAASVSVPSVAVCGSPEPTKWNTTESPAWTLSAVGKYALIDSFTARFAASTVTVNASAAGVPTGPVAPPDPRMSYSSRGATTYPMHLPVLSRTTHGWVSKVCWTTFPPAGIVA